jgi:hypothetical protein
VFTGAGKCTDQTESSHVTISKLVDTAFETWSNMRHEDDEQERVHLRSTLKRTIDLMKRRNCYFAKYTKVVDIEPAAGKAKLTSNTTTQDAIDSRFSRLRSEGGNETGSNTYRASVQFQDSKSADQRPATKDTIHPSLHSVFSIDSHRSHRPSTTAVGSRLSHPSFSTSTDYVFRISPPPHRLTRAFRIAPSLLHNGD